MISLWHKIPPPRARCFSEMPRIALEVALAHGVTLADLRGPNRLRKVTVARQEAFARCRAMKETGGLAYSYPAIAHYFGRSDHTTVIHGVRRHEARQAAAQ